MLLEKIKKILKAIYDSQGTSSLYRNAMHGFPNSQFELATLYYEKKDYVEAYAWAELACINRLRGATKFKKLVEERLDPDHVKQAWDLARQYKAYFFPDKQKKSFLKWKWW